jgi:hypothetical protein
VIETNPVARELLLNRSSGPLVNINTHGAEELLLSRGSGSVSVSVYMELRS